MAEMRQVRDFVEEQLSSRGSLADQTADRELRELVQNGVSQIQEGKVSPFDEEAVARIKNRGRQLLARKR